MYLTIEDLKEATGYSKNTIYNLCVALGIKPTRGLIPGNISKGVYNKKDLDTLVYYKQLLDSGKTKDEALREAKCMN